MVGFYTKEKGSQKYPLPFFNLFYPSTGDFIGVVGNLRSRSLVKKIAAEFKKYSRFPLESLATFEFIEGVDFSDNWSFWQEGYKAVMITDTAFYRNPHYHTASDTPETLDYRSMAEIVEGLYHVLLELAK